MSIGCCSCLLHKPMIVTMPAGNKDSVNSRSLVTPSGSQNSTSKNTLCPTTMLSSVGEEESDRTSRLADGV